MKARTQDEHKAINAREYPGTREMCIECGEPTGKAGKSDGSLYYEDGRGPFCERCYNCVSFDRIKIDEDLFYRIVACDPGINVIGTPVASYNVIEGALYFEYGLRGSGRAILASEIRWTRDPETLERTSEREEFWLLV